MRLFNTHTIIIRKLVLFVFLFANSHLFCQSSIADWKYKTGGSIYSSLSINENSIYVGSTDNTFYSLHLDGTFQWSYKCKNVIKSEARLQDTIVCFQSGNALYALHADDGRLLWKHESEKALNNEATEFIDPVDFHDSSPVIHNSKVYYGNEFGEFWGIDLITGNELFKSTADNGAPIRATVCIVDSIAYVGDFEGMVYALNLNDTSSIWKAETFSIAKPYDQFGPIIGELVVWNDNLYFPLHNGLFQVLDRFTGETKWETGNYYGTWFSGIPVITDGVLYVSTSDSKILYAYDAETGSELWQASINKGMYGKCVLYEDKIIVLGGYGDYDKVASNNDSGMLWILDLDGNELFSMNLDRSVFGSPHIVNDVLYFGSTDNNIYALSISKLLKTTSIKTSFINSYSLYPNPYSDDVSMNNTSIKGDVQILFYSMNGVLLNTVKYDNNSHCSLSDINIEELCDSAINVLYEVFVDGVRKYSDVLIKSE